LQTARKTFRFSILARRTLPFPVIEARRSRLYRPSALDAGPRELGMKERLKTPRLLLLGSLPLALLGCPGDAEDSDETTMCYEKSGTTLVLNCYTDYLHSCSEDGKTSLGSYDTWDSCYDDMDSVLANYKQDGAIEPGPSSTESGSSSGSSSSPKGGGSYNYSFSCPGGYGSTHTLPIPSGSCEKQYESYGRAFGCNLVEQFESTCTALYSCLHDSQNLAVCKNY